MPCSPTSRSSAGPSLNRRAGDRYRRLHRRPQCCDRQLVDLSRGDAPRRRSVHADCGSGGYGCRAPIRPAPAPTPAGPGSSGQTPAGGPTVPSCTDPIEPERLRITRRSRLSSTHGRPGSRAAGQSASPSAEQRPLDGAKVIVCFRLAARRARLEAHKIPLGRAGVRSSKFDTNSATYSVVVPELDSPMCLRRTGPLCGRFRSCVVKALPLLAHATWKHFRKHSPAENWIWGSNMRRDTSRPSAAVSRSRCWLARMLAASR